LIKAGGELRGNSDGIESAPLFSYVLFIPLIG
jgi:hypothetical protein